MVDGRFSSWNFQDLCLLFSLAEGRLAVSLQEEVSLNSGRACEAHRDLLANASVNFVRKQRSALLSDVVVLVAGHDRFSKVLPRS